MKNITFKEKINLSNYTTIKVGGFAEYFSKPNDTNAVSYTHLTLPTNREV